MKLNAVFPLSMLSPDCANTFFNNSVVTRIPFCVPPYCSSLLLLHGNCKLFCDLILGESLKLAIALKLKKKRPYFTISFQFEFQKR